MRLGRTLKMGIIALALGLTLSAAPKANAAKAIDGHCGMHFAKLVRRDQKGSQWNVRTGPKRRGGSSACRGLVRVIRHGKNLPNVGVLAWQPINMPGWNEHNVILITSGTVTVIGCNAAAKGLVAGLEAISIAGTDGLAFPGVTAAAGVVGCGLGTRELYNLLPNGPRTIDKVREIK